jgi:hypothetical protein
MSQFAEHSGQLVAMVSEGLPLTEACKRAGVAYDTARNWVTAGRRDPDGEYGAFVTALDRGRMSAVREDDDLGPVEREVERLIGGRELEGEVAVAAAQARALARKVDALAASPGGSAGLALASVSRRLEDCVALLRLERRDWLTRMQEERAARIAADRNHYSHKVTQKKTVT